MTKETIIIDCKWMEHSGGTKFYEVIQFSNVDERRFVLVRRWGAMRACNGGGQIKVEEFRDVRAMQDAAVKIAHEKQKSGYEVSRSRYGLHDISRSLGAFGAHEEIAHHYESAGARSILNAVFEDADAIESGDAIDDAMRPAEPAAPPPDRGDNWGSW